MSHGYFYALFKCKTISVDECQLPAAAYRAAKSKNKKLRLNVKIPALRSLNAGRPIYYISPIVNWQTPQRPSSIDARQSPMANRLWKTIVSEAFTGKQLRTVVRSLQCVFLSCMQQKTIETTKTSEVK